MIDIKEIFRPMGLWEAETRQIYAKVDLLPIDSESEKKKVAKKNINHFKFLKNSCLFTSCNA